MTELAVTTKGGSRLSSRANVVESAKHKYLSIFVKASLQQYNSVLTF
jgi:hypothetical protein